MNIKSHTHVVYPTFHDSYHAKTKTNKEIDIDSSVYHLLSLYLNKDALADNKTLLSTMATTHTSTRSPKSLHWKKSSHMIRTQKSWLGEEKSKRKDDKEILLERNTLKNSSIQSEYVHKTVHKKTRSKSVSFSDTVTIILPQNDIETARLEEEDLFVDALEHL
ncbi:uncharacterized protein B0P05DRAFT_531345, partial [Gilbertella persicaria]|uniref:uncharacterized protein n=1 Tax=Gilbertella persicaria TaxID=101096 RepID=UPI00221EC6CD